MGVIKDLTGQTFGQLTVLKRVENNTRSKKIKWLCQCDCGNQVEVMGCNLVCKRTFSCGCFALKRSKDIRKQNSYKIDGDIVTVGTADDNKTFTINLCDLELIKGRYWRVMTSGYVASYKVIDGKQHCIYLHRYLMNPSEDYVIDHIDGNKANNLRNNLRICTQDCNAKNHKAFITSTSGVCGVVKTKSGKKWAAQIWHNNKMERLGTFETFEEACAARKAGEEKYFGEYARKVGVV